jgi:hypothetical protein
LNAQDRRGSLLLGAAHARYGRTGYVQVIASRVPVGQHAIGDSHAGIRPAGDRAAGPELRVVRMGDHHERPLDPHLRLGRSSLTCRPKRASSHASTPASRESPRRNVARAANAHRCTIAVTGDKHRQPAIGREPESVEMGRLELHCIDLLHQRSGGCRASDLRFHRQPGVRSCPLVSMAHPSAADPARTSGPA